MPRLEENSPTPAALRAPLLERLVGLRDDRPSNLPYNPQVIYATLAIMVLALLCHLSLESIYHRQQVLVQNHLQSSLNSLSKLISTWQQQHVAAIQVIADTPRGRENLRAVLRDGGKVEASNQALQDMLLPLMEPLGYDGFSVFSPDRIVLAATSADYVGKAAQLPETLEVMDRALAGSPAISRPMAAYRPIDGPRGAKPKGVLFQLMCVTQAGDQQELLGYFCFRFDPQMGFFPIFASALSGTSGEVYAIDLSGNIITPSRFIKDRPLQAKVPEKQRRAATLTRAAEQLLSGKSFHSSTVYLDYRGIPVVGSGRWLEDMNIGLISEQDYDEAFAPYLAARDVILGLTLSATALLIVLSFMSVLNRRKLAQRESRFRALLENLPTPVYMKSLDGKFTVLNSAFCKLMQWPKNGIIDGQASKVMIPNWLAPIFEMDTLVQPPFDVDTKMLDLRNPAGNVNYYNIIRFPVMQQNASVPTAIATIIVDETDRVLANHRLSDINIQLEYLVEERTHELQQAKETAVAASKTKAEFLANMSHEIRTPLNAVLGLAHLTLAEQLAPKVQTYLEKIQASGQHLLQVINDILDFSRIEAGKLTLDRRVFNLTQLLDSTLNFVWERAQSKGLELKIIKDSDVPDSLMGDPLRLGQILINFLANAVKFTEQGHIHLRVSCINSNPATVELEFCVEDTGIGIDPTSLAGLFQPFHQVDSSSKRRFQGSGLGLAICQNLATLMGGQISVTSTSSVGSCFYLRVNLAQASPRTKTTNQAKQTLPQIRSHVLVVEDDPLNREITEALCRACGASVVAVGDGYTALVLLAKERFDVILMDIQMPGMDGLETTQKIRELPSAECLPIIAVTANALPGDRERYLAEGLDDYLTKPINPNQLHHKLLHWQTHQQALQPPARPHPPNSSTVSFASLEEAGVATQTAIHNLLGNTDLYLRLLQRFVSEREHFPEEINAALQQQNFAKIRELTHSLRSLAASLGLLSLAHQAGQVENAIVSGETTVHVDELTIQFRQDLTLIRAWLDQLPK